jgi:hypothetical protein
MSNLPRLQSTILLDYPIHLQLLHLFTTQQILTVFHPFTTSYSVSKFHFSNSKLGLLVLYAICKDRYPGEITPWCR